MDAVYKCILNWTELNKLRISISKTRRSSHPHRIPSRDSVGWLLIRVLLIEMRNLFRDSRQLLLHQQRNSDDWSQTRRTGLARAAANNQAPAVLSGLDNELARYIVEISGPSDVECLDWHSWQDIWQTYPSFPLWNLISLQPQHHRRTAYVERVFFGLQGAVR